MSGPSRAPHATGADEEGSGPATHRGDPATDCDRARGWPGFLRFLDRADARLASRRGKLLALGCVLSLAAILRLVYFAQVSQTHGFGTPLVDSRGYEEQALGILAGDWPRADQVFFVDPLYSYLLAGYHALFGLDRTGLLVLQLALGTISAGLIQRLAAAILRPSEALLAGVFAAAYGVFFFYEALELKTSWSVFTVSSFLLALVHARRSAGLSALSGLMLGLGVLLRGNLLALLPVACLWLAWPARVRRSGSGLARGLALFVGLALPLAPVTLHNLAAGDFVLTTANAGQNFYIGNSPHNTTGSYVAPPGVRANPRFEEVDFKALAEEETGRELPASEISRFWFEKALTFIRDEPRRAAALLRTKLLLFFNRVEVPDNANFSWTREGVPLLRAPLPSWGLFVVLATIALCLRRPSPRFLLLAAVVGTLAASVIAFFVTSRFRAPITPPLIVLAAAWPGALAEALARRARLRIALAALAGAAALWVTRLDVYSVSRTMLYYNHAAIAAQERDQELALDYLDDALASDGKNWRARLLMGQLCAELGRDADARRELRRARELAPEEAEPRYRLGLFHAQRGRFDAAARELRGALELAPSYDAAIVELAEIERVSGATEAARTRLLELLERAPLKAAALNVLGMILAQEGQLDEARERLESAVRVRPANPRYRLNLARCLRLDGRSEAAREQLQAVLAQDPDNDQAREELRFLPEGE